MASLQISGQITVRVDEVDIEQMEMVYPAIMRYSNPSLKATIAASMAEEFKRFWRQIGQYKMVPNGIRNEGDIWFVTFDIEPDLEEGIAA